ncbi:hypothetical protein FJW05_23070 [Mesorhizobium sp. B2-9-1]|uniref:hypothetical protein n=1 Tax=Mesorhizobium sp. B2-9-1 TaxID=2589898 RepID=UPI001129F032|nr:hypothetical protein [Mesorhizobium sp. B2-9-1]TPI43236.1 hypothetical protein FJW05_23070 [Mesorhizobium sp. B2-9-1]
MIKPHVSESGLAYPDDLALLKRIYDEVCEERGIVLGSPEASDLAIEAMRLFSAGVFDEVTIGRRLRGGGRGDRGVQSPSP